MKNISFEPFQAIGKRFRNTISITKACAIGFNSGFYFNNGIKEWTHARLFYSKEPKALAFQLTKDKNTPGALQITHHPRGNSGYITARSFINAYGIDVNKYAGKYRPYERKDPKHGRLFYILLDEKIDDEG